MTLFPFFAEVLRAEELKAVGPFFWGAQRAGGRFDDPTTWASIIRIGFWGLGFKGLRGLGF